MVRPRWSDMDAFGHVNHASMVTLLEEARVPLLFDGARRAGLTELPKGIVVVRLAVRYHAPVIVGDGELRIEMSLSELRFSSFTVDYKVHSGPSESDKVAVTAETVLAPYDVGRGGPRRLSDAERDFLAEALSDGGSP
ncbi:acyl-CoA thioesterase [Amycolatopsis anabasis]|uniref:acyl-CoA thioesterase n=1 Tax=Amycolatopsis anabasis TaxID=1840409 RepID=UPI0015D40875|nr:thioesterase family protein [Amycolatopsis anabasis]